MNYIPEEQKPSQQNYNHPGCRVVGCSSFVMFAIYSMILIGLGWGMRGCSEKSKKNTNQSQVIKDNKNAQIGLGALGYFGRQK